MPSRFGYWLGYFLSWCLWTLGQGGDTPLNKNVGEEGHCRGPQPADPQIRR